MEIRKLQESRPGKPNLAKVIAHPASGDHLVSIGKTNRSTIAVPTSEGIHFIDITAIAYCSADGNYTHIHLQDGRSIMISRTLGILCDILPAHLFVRTHQSHLVNSGRITMLGQDHVQLDDGTELPVSRHRRTALRERLCKTTLHF